MREGMTVATGIRRPGWQVKVRVAIGVAGLSLLAASEPAALAAQQTGTLVLSVRVLPVVELEVPSQVSLTNTQEGQQASVQVTVRTNAPWQVQLSPQPPLSGPFAAAGRVRWRVGQQNWQDVASAISWQSQAPTGSAGHTLPVEFQYQPSLDDPAGDYTLSLAVTVSSLVP